MPRPLNPNTTTGYVAAADPVGEALCLDPSTSIPIPIPIATSQRLVSGEREPGHPKGIVNFRLLKSI